MSRRRREAMRELNAAEEQTNSSGAEPSATGKKGWWRSLNGTQRWLAIGVIAFLSIGALGAGLKYLEDSAREEKARLQQDPLARNDSLLASVNPFMPPPTPTPTPQLSKEYIYAGSRMLAIEDSGGNSIPPADLAYWRPSNGNWYCMGGAGGSQAFQVAWGTNGDQPASGDYDGDGKADLAIFRPSTGTWWIVRSSDGGYYTVSLGTSGDVVAQADFDGDGKTDPAVYRSSNATWYLIYSTTGSSASANFGASGHVPVPSDYDGDGKADIATWYNAGLTFYYYSSIQSQQLTQGLGSSGTTYTAAPGDYDGDGKADFAIFSAGSWVIKPSGGGSNITASWGTTGDVAVPHDYDGDGKSDIAIWRPSTGYWWIVYSHNSTYTAVAWGQNGDIPVPGFYRR